MRRIFLFLATNLAVLALLTVVVFVIERVFGVRLTGGGLGAVLVFGDMVTLVLLQGVLNTFVIFLARSIHPPTDERIAALQTLGTV